MAPQPLSIPSTLLAAPLAPPGILRVQFKTIELHSSLKSEMSKGNPPVADTEPKTDSSCDLEGLLHARLGTGTQMSQTHFYLGASPLMGETDVCQGLWRAEPALTLHQPHICLHIPVYIAKWLGDIGFHSGRRGTTLTGVLVSARGSIQTFLTLLST